MIERSSKRPVRDSRAPEVALPVVHDKEKRILVLAPTANDAPLSAGFLTQAGMEAEICRDMYDLCHRVNQGCGAILIAEEAIGSTSVAVLVQTLSHQPSWSDIPVAIITSGGEASQTRLRRLSVFGPSGNVTLIERPFRPSTLTSTLEVVLRFRQRQYMVRDLLEEGRESKQHLEFVLKSGGLGAWKLDLRTQIVTWSETCKANFGLQDGDEITLDRLTKMVHPEDRGRMLQAMERAIKNGTEFRAEYRITSPSGEMRWIHSTGRVAFNESGTALHLSGVTQNITEGKRAELALRESAEKLEQTVEDRTAALQQTIHSLETFNYSIAHDLRAPLRAMSGFSEALLQDYEPTLDEQGKDYLQRIRKSAVRMDRLVSDILDYGRLAQQNIPLEVVAVDEVLTKVLNDLHSEIEQKGAIVEVKHPLPAVIANASVLNQVLLNLASNAFKFVVPGKTPRLRIWSEKRGDLIRLSFEDNGIGIAREHREKVFEMFQQLHRSEYSGTGIGLALVKKGVERMNGIIGLDSECGKGSCFWIELPSATSLPS